jgi:hypothetical protein
VKEELEKIEKYEEERRKNQEMKEEWERISGSKEKALYQKFIDDYPDSAFCEKAKDEINKIEKEEEREIERRKKVEEAKKKVKNRSKQLGSVLNTMSTNKKPGKKK